MCLQKKFKLFLRREHRLKYKTFLLFQTLIAQTGSFLCGFQYSILRIPVAKLF